MSQRTRQIENIIVVPEPLAPETRRRAALTVAANLPTHEAREVLDMLGLLDVAS